MMATGLTVGPGKFRQISRGMRVRKFFNSARNAKRRIGKLRGTQFEDYLTKKYKGTGSFSKRGRQFDGAKGNRWWEAKSGRYWKDHTKPNSKGWGKFTSDMGARQKIAKDSGATLELHSNSPIPKHVKSWLSKRGIDYFEH